MKIIGLTGSATSGKDSFYEFAKEFFVGENLKCKRFAFADLLKHELSSFIFNNFGFSSFTNNKENKNILRPIMVAYGCAKREVSKGRYWIENIEKSLQSIQEFTDVAIITDVRFCDYENDEVYWLKDKMKGHLINISLVNPDGSIVQPANEDEAKRSSKLQELSDSQFSWNKFGDDEIKKAQARNKVIEFLKSKEKIWK